MLMTRHTQYLLVPDMEFTRYVGCLAFVNDVGSVLCCATDIVNGSRLDPVDVL